MRFIKKYFTDSGYTMIELIVALTIFSIVIVGITQVAVSVLRVQRGSSEMQNIEDNARAIFESMVREVRTGHSYKVVENGKRFCFSAAGTSATAPFFARYFLDSGIIYRTSVTNGEEAEYKSCSNNSNSDTLAFNSNNVVVEDLTFKINSGDHKMITIFMKIKGNTVSSKSVILQTTVSSRYYAD